MLIIKVESKMPWISKGLFVEVVGSKYFHKCWRWIGEITHSFLQSWLVGSKPNFPKSSIVSGQRLENLQDDLYTPVNFAV